MWYGFSDAATEFHCQDRLSFRQFLRRGIDERIPEATTLENFRHELRATGLDTFFKEQGLLLKAGHRVDASSIKANSKPKKNADKQSDCDAEWGHKGFGYSAALNADRFVR